MRPMLRPVVSVRSASLLASASLLLLCGGCVVAGVTYKMPMPNSVTIGTIKADDAGTRTPDTAKAKNFAVATR